MKHIISLGAGVQSSTMALMAAHGEITPMPDCAIFADTQAEPKAVYDWLDWLEKQLPFPVHRVSKGSLREKPLTLRYTGKGEQYSRNGIPAFVKNEDGTQGMLSRHCTNDYKITPINRKIRKLVGLKKGARTKEILACSWMGISLDEMQRMKESRVKWIQHRFPLFEQRITRNDCFGWMIRNGYPKPPRSACTFCPYRKDDEWRIMKDADPEAFKDAVEFERQWQEISLLDDRKEKLKGIPYIHRSMVPLDQVDFSTAADHGQISFLDECDGMCGV